jgi:hypothetical protein
MRKRDKKKQASSDADSLPEGPMDKREQEKLIKSLQDQAERQARNARRMFSVVFLIVSSLMVLLLIRSLTVEALDLIHEEFFATSKFTVTSGHHYTLHCKAVTY